MAGNVKLSPLDLEILSELDALAFGFVRLSLEESPGSRKKQVALKAVAFMERLVVERQARLNQQRHADSNNNGSRNPLIDPLTYCKLGHLHLLLGDYTKALSAYQKYATLTPNQYWRNTVYLYGQGLVFFHFNAFRWATKVFQQVLYLEPGFPRVNEIHIRLGIMAKVNNDFGTSLRHFQMAQINTAPCTFNEAEINFHIAHLHEVYGKYAKANLLYRDLLKDPDLSSPLRADVHRQLGWIFYSVDAMGEKMGRIQTAIQHLQKSIEIDAKSGQSLYLLGRCHAAMGKVHEAFIAYRNSVDKSESNADTWCSIGVFHSMKSKQLPSVEEAWNLPVSNEMAGRQSNAMKGAKVSAPQNGPSDPNKRFKSESNPGNNAPPALTPQQLQTLHHLQSQASLVPPQQQLLQTLQSQLHNYRQYQVKVQQQRVVENAVSSLDSGELVNADILAELQNKDLGSVSDRELEALISQQDIGSFAESLLKQIQADGVEHHDMEVDGERDGDDEDSGRSTRASHQTENGVMESKDSIMECSTDNRDDSGFKLEDGGVNAQVTSLDIPTHLEVVRSTKSLCVDTSMTSDEILLVCKKWFESNTELSLTLSMTDKGPPEPPERPQKSLSKENLLPPTPSVYLENRKDASSAQLQEFCIKHPITVVRGIASALKLDLGLFSTKQLVETHGSQKVDVITQLKQNADENWDFNLTKQVWHCIVTKSNTTISKYAQYQTATFQDSLKEEQEKGGSGGFRGDLDLDGREETRRRRKQQSFLQFGMNVDLSEQRHWRTQLTELMKLPPWARVVSAGNMLTHIGYPIPGMNTVQLQMKVPCSRTFARQESNNFCAIDINIGPGDCEWFAVPYEYWGAVRTLCEKHGVNFSHGSWWPNMKDLMEEEVPVYRFLQRPGDMVWVNSGCLYWVQAVGWCNNIKWNVGPLTNTQYNLALERYEWNKLLGMKSRVPMVHLSWSLARNVRLNDEALYKSMKNTLVQSLKRTILILEYLKSAGIELKHHSRKRHDPAHYCAQCEREVFAILFVREIESQHIVSCFDCARSRSPDLKGLVCLEEVRLSDLKAVHDGFRFQDSATPEIGPIEAMRQDKRKFQEGKLDVSLSSSELLSCCKDLGHDDGDINTRLYDAPPVNPPKSKATSLSREELLPPTPSVYVRSKEEAYSPQLLEFCLQKPIVLIRNLASICDIDLQLYSTKRLVQSHPSHPVEIRSQMEQTADENWDPTMSKQVWYCTSSRSHTTIAKYAEYQASNLEETWDTMERTVNPKFDFSDKPTRRMIKFGTNCDLSDEKKWAPQLNDLWKLPAWLRVVSAGNMLSHVGHQILGMNTVQLYMKVPCARTPGHQENNNFCAVNINIGPGDSEWFGVANEYWSEVEQFCHKNGLSYLHGSWWPNISELTEAGIPCYRFLQKPGDVVFVNSGCVHWVQATGWCNNIAWNVGPLTHRQYAMAMERYEWNKSQKYQSIVAMTFLSWNLARNLRVSDSRLFLSIRAVLMQSIRLIVQQLSFAETKGIKIRFHGRKRNEPVHYCGLCDEEVYNVLFVKENEKRHTVHCLRCARTQDSDLKG
ncbi:hypothetical protein TCAL_01654, partial [Tigriopus californicus]|eukprot:TCALIF_01654-PA protein Name:"Similar to UTY Histone demethylase UTY (Homo sapiens)" AED:0.02 eAED:0.03 QI:44/0/0/1/0.5/0.33/3/0/1560